MVLCANDHDNLDGLSHCRVCGLPLLDLRQEFVSLAGNLAARDGMGRPLPHIILVGLGTAGAGLIDISKTTYGDSASDRSYLAIDTTGTTLPTESSNLLWLNLGGLTPSAGTFCGIGEALTKCDPCLIPILRKAGLSHHDGNQVVLLVAGVGGGIGSAVSVLVEKCRQLNPGCYTVALVIVPGADESFHNHLNAYYGMSRLLETGARQAADVVIAVHYERMRKLRGVGMGGEELKTEGLLAALSDLLVRNLSSPSIAELVRINRSMRVGLVVPCLALGRSLEIFGSLSNILESAIAYPANVISRQAVLVCHLLLRVPRSVAVSFGEEVVTEELTALVRRHLPYVRASSSSITYSDEQHDRVDACILLGGDSATSALFADDISLAGFQDELGRQTCWQTYGLSEESIKLAQDVIAEYDSILEQVRGDQTERAEKARGVIGKSALKVRRRGRVRRDTPGTKHSGAEEMISDVQKKELNG